MIDAEIKVTAEVAAEHGLSSDEYARVLEILGREPNITELGIFSVMWSEHCSYKSSKVHLKRLPTHGARVIQGPGENAGVVDIGDGLCAVFKIESHNHPSFVEPFQGAATGVGGILRDIFTMGARPIAVLDSLRFGPITSGSAALHPSSAATSASSSELTLLPKSPRVEAGTAAAAAAVRAQSHAAEASAEEIARNRRIFDGVVSGIAFYGNCFGVPTVGGEAHFEPCYSSNPLVNVLALGTARRDQLFFARARGSGNPVIYVGAKTGRDGIHGASLLASAEFSEESQQKRPNVQVGDPFMEKLLLEACLEAMHSGAVVAIQDMGAAGLTSSSSEMASRGGMGIEIDLARVPQRETGMTAYDIMLSESQERMLLIAERGREREVLEVFSKWGLDAVEIGRITDDRKLRVLDHGRAAAEIPAHTLAEEAPVYERPLAPPATSAAKDPLIEFAAPGVDLTRNFLKLLASPAIASKRWIFTQYDHMVRTNTRIGPGAGDAAVVRIKGTDRALALSTDGNGRWCQLAPRLGAMHAVAEAARNVACVGAQPIAATNCLNFGNPQKPEIMWQFREVVEGIAEACRELEIPITGGNVSFYNETLGKAIYPTPVLGMLGLIEDVSTALGMGFRHDGDEVILLEAGVKRLSAEQVRREFSSSEYAKAIGGVTGGSPPEIQLAAERRLTRALAAMATEGVLASAHDLSDGGLAAALGECCFEGPGLSTHIAFKDEEPPEVVLFGERGARGVVSARADLLARLKEIAAQYEVRARGIGQVTQGDFRIQLNGHTVVSAAVESLRETWGGALERALRNE